MDKNRVQTEFFEKILKSISREKALITQYEFSGNTETKHSSRLTYFFIIGTRSWLLLKALQAAGNWLSVDLDGRGNGNGHKMTQFLKDLKVVNDLAKRCIKEIVLKIILLMEKIYLA